MKKLLPILVLLLLTNLTAIGQTLTYTFVDPCTKEITQFNLPIQSGNGSLMSFLGQQKYFTADDVNSGVFAAWINQVYTEYRRLTPCSIQTTTIIRNQITSQIIGSTIQSVVGTIMGQVNLESGMLVNGDLSSNTDKDNKKTKNNGNSSSGGNGNVSTQNVSGTKPVFAISPNPTISPTSTTSEKQQQPVASSVGTNDNRDGGTTGNNPTSTSSSTNTNVQTNGKNISTNKGVDNGVSTKTQGNNGPSVKNNSTNASTTSNSTNTSTTSKYRFDVPAT